MVSIENINQAKQTYNKNPTQQNYQLYSQLVDKYNISTTEQNRIEKERYRQQEAQYIESIPSEVKSAGSFAVNEYTSIGIKLGEGKISQAQAQQQLEQLYQKYPETQKVYKEMQQQTAKQQELAKRFESYDEYGKIAFFIKNPQYIESLPQEDKDKILAGIAEGKHYVEEMLSGYGKAERGTGIFLAGGGGEYRVLNEYYAHWKKAKERGDTAKMAEYEENMIVRATKLKLQQQGFDLGGYILAQPMTQVALTYLLTKGLMKLPKPVQYGVGAGFVGIEAPQTIAAYKEGKLLPYAQSMIPAFAGGALAGVSARTTGAIEKAYTPKEVKGPSVTQKAYSAVESKFPGVKPIKTKITSYKPVESYLGYKSKLRAGYTKGYELPLSKKPNITRTSLTKKGVQYESYGKLEVFGGRGKKTLLSPAETKAFKPGTTGEFTYKGTKRGPYYDTMNLVEYKKISRPTSKFGFKKVKVSKGSVRAEKTYTMGKPIESKYQLTAPKQKIEIASVERKGLGSIERPVLEDTSIPKFETPTTQKGFPTYYRGKEIKGPLYIEGNVGPDYKWISYEPKSSFTMREPINQLTPGPKKPYLTPEQTPQAYGKTWGTTKKLSFKKQPLAKDITASQQINIRPELPIQRPKFDAPGKARWQRLQLIKPGVTSIKVPATYFQPNIQLSKIGLISGLAPIQQTSQASLSKPSIKQIQPQMQVPQIKSIQIQQPLQKMAQIQQLKTLQKLKLKQIVEPIEKTKPPTYKLKPVAIKTRIVPIISDDKKEKKKKIVKKKIPKKLKYREREFKIKQFKLYKPKKVKL